MTAPDALPVLTVRNPDGTREPWSLEWQVKDDARYDMERYLERTLPRPNPLALEPRLPRYDASDVGWEPVEPRRDRGYWAWVRDYWRRTAPMPTKRNVHRYGR